MRASVNFFLATLIYCGGAAVGAEQGDSRSLAGFDQISVAHGITVHIACGGDNKAVLSGRPDEIADTRTAVSGHVLQIERGSVVGRHETVDIALTVAAPLDAIKVSTGSAVEAPACALSTDHLDVNASTGASVSLAGNSNRVSLDVSTGAMVQPLSGQRFDAGTVHVSASTGAGVRLCAVRTLDGSASLGAGIETEAPASSALHTSLGAAHSVRACH